MGDMTIIDAIYRLIPEVIYSPHNKEIMPKNFSYLRSLIQADNYKFKGVFSF
jgi:tRNA G37 N-methylase TrmD